MLNSMIKKKDAQLKLPAVELQGIFSVEYTPPLVPLEGGLRGVHSLTPKKNCEECAR